MASSKHQRHNLCFYNLPFFYDDNLIPEIKIQAMYMHDILRSLISYSLSQRALSRASEARLTGALSNGGKMRGVATNVYLWETSEKPKETGQNENSKFESCIYV